MGDVIFRISLYLGLAGFTLFVFSFLSGLRIIKPKSKYHLHKRVGIIGFSAIVIHALVMSYFYFFT
jgi:hypothetical protein